MGILESGGQYNGVGMILPTAGHSSCTGVMLSRIVFLTAAQCVQDQSPNPIFEFTLGPGMTAHATEIRAHPFFDTVDGINLAFDIALVALDEVEVGTWTGITRLAIRGNLVPDNSDATAVGFGETQTGAGSGQKRSGNLLVTQYTEGLDQNGQIIPSAFIEVIPADTQNNMFCAGDVGGPLIYNNAIAGVASFRNVEHCDDQGPGYYVSLGPLAGWIGENLNDLDPSATVPEPSTLLLLGAGLAGMLGFGRTRSFKMPLRASRLPRRQAPRRAQPLPHP